MKNLIKVIIAVLIATALILIGIGLSKNKIVQEVVGNISVNTIGGSLNATTTGVTTSLKIVSASTITQYARIQAGSVPVYLRFYPNTTTNAVYLAAYGSYEINNNNLYNGEIWATSTAGESVLSIITK